eukprot:248235_1
MDYMDDQQNNSPLNTTQTTSIDKRHKLMQYKKRNVGHQKNYTYTNRYIPKIHIIKPEIISFKTIPQNSAAHNPAVFKPQSTNEQCFSVNQVREWYKKKGVTTIESKRAIKQSISDAQDAHDKIIYAYAPTGKNPELSQLQVI